MTHLAGGQAAGAADTVDAAQQEGHYAGLPEQQSKSETTMYMQNIYLNEETFIGNSATTSSQGETQWLILVEWKRV